MPSKYPICTPEQVISALKRAGFSVVSQRGSHVKMSNGNNIVIVPDHGRDLKTGTLKSILLQACMDVEQFKSYL